MFRRNAKRKRNDDEKEAGSRKKVKVEPKKGAGKDEGVWEGVEEDIEWEWIAKIEMLCEMLESIRKKDPKEKTIVYSQVSRLLSITHTVYEFLGPYSKAVATKKL